MIRGIGRGALADHSRTSRPLRFHPASRRSPLAAAGAVGHQDRRGVFRTLLGGSVLSLVMTPTTSNVALAARGSPAEKVLEDPNWPKEFPFGAEAFSRYDENPDTFFYSQPRFVTHIDDGAISALTKYYSKVFPESGRADVAVLDMCSSWISHYPKGFKAGRISGLGMNMEELQRNPVLTDFEVKDLNADPTLPYDDNTFDVITNTVSVDYLNKPIQVFQEMHRVLKVGGRAIMSFSNRCFPTKAISIWTSTSDLDHIWIVGAYFHYSVPGGYTPPQGLDISARSFLPGDPMFVVTATKAPSA